jgi:hypothetical protein
MFFVWEPSTSQAGCHDKLNKVYEGVVEGCSLAGARLRVTGIHRSAGHLVLLSH